MAYYLMAPDGGTTKIAPSLWKRRGIGTTPHAGDKPAQPQNEATTADHKNPTVIPQEVLSGFKFAFLIRHPSRGIPSFFRCTKPPLDGVTGWDKFMPSEAGYRELRAFFEYVCAFKGLSTASAASQDGDSHTSHTGAIENDWRESVMKQICVLDADDLLDNPSSVVQAFCRRVGLNYDPDMLTWDTKEDQEYAERAFEKWRGWHEDALQSKSLTPRKHVGHNLSPFTLSLRPDRTSQGKPLKSRDEEDSEWQEKYGIEGSRTIRSTVDENIKDYEYLKQFAWDPKNDDI